MPTMTWTFMSPIVILLSTVFIIDVPLMVTLTLGIWSTFGTIFASSGRKLLFTGLADFHRQRMDGLLKR
jgi:hypothetical protein